MKFTLNYIAKLLLSISLVAVFILPSEAFARKTKSKKRAKKGSSYSKNKSKSKSKKKKYYAAKGVKKRAYVASSPTKLDSSKVSKYLKPSNVILNEELNAEMIGGTDNSFSLDESEFYKSDPNFDIYAIDDTINVNPYKIKLDELEEGVVLNLQDSTRCDYSHPFKGNVTSGFGPRWSRFHMGIDIDLKTGDTVVSAFEGTVRIARRSSTFGNVVMIRHKNGLETIYAHLSQLNVRPGQHVESGEIIGLGGNTGRSFGDHLHFEVRYKGLALDPSKIISFDDYSLYCNELYINKEIFAAHQFTNKVSNHKHSFKYYKVRKGDSLSSIARKLGTTTKVLKRLNKVSAKNLRKGKLLKYV
jgi:murein DD-endopeptidase MepM/ murein hydrolase activator NlpD